MNEKRLQRRIFRVLRPLALSALLAWPAAVLAYLALSLPSEPAELAAAVEPIWVDPAEITIAGRTDVEVLLSGREAEQILSHGWQAIVSRVDVAPGDQITSNTVIAVVGTTPIVALSSSEPFTRDLSVGDRGTDVAALQGFLSQNGFYPAENVDGTYGSATGRAVKTWRKSLGDSSSNQTFNYRQTVWLNTERFEVTSLNLQVGHVPPELGEAIVEGQETFNQVQVVTPQTTEAATISSDLTLHVADRLELGPISTALTGEQVTQLLELLAQSPEVAVPPKSGATPPPANSDEVRIPAHLVPVDPPQVLSVPGSSVVNGDLGRTCVITMTDNLPTVVHVDVVGGELGVVYLDPESVPNLPVLVNPIVASPDLVCHG